MKNSLPFTQEDLENLANERSFEQGADYYQEGAVKSITCCGNHYEGKVRGSDLYHVTLDIEDDELDFDCTCPYDFDGICKHCVAFGLAVLNGEYKEVAEIKSVAGSFSTEKFKECFEKADSQQKLNFLKQLIDSDINLQSQFVVFMQSETKQVFDNEEDEVDIDSVAEEIRDELSFLDFDYAMKSGHHHYNYYGNEGRETEAYQLIDNTLKPYYTTSVEYLKEGNLLDAFRTILGIYEGTQNLDEPASDYDLFYDGYESIVSEYVCDYFRSFAKETEQIVRSNESVKSVIDLFFERYNEFQNSEVEEDSEKIVYDVSHFEKIFISLLSSTEIADYLIVKIRENDLESLEFADVVLKIADLTDNQKLWVETSESFAEFSFDIANNLLIRYKRSNQTENFNRIALLMFSKWADRINLYLYENLDKENQRELYIDVLNNLTKSSHKIKYYNELREYFSEEQKNTFIENLSKSYCTEFYIEVLEVEKQFDAILQYIQNHTDSYSLQVIINPILNIYPNECFNILKTRCERELNSSKRDRRTYQHMTTLMQCMQKITTKQIESRQFFQSMFANRLPALKDEINNAKLL